MTLSEKQKDILNSAQRYFEEGQYDKVTPLLNSLVAQKVQRAEVHHIFGSIYYERGQFKDSISSFKRALQLNPDFTDSAVGLSVVLNDLGKYEQAQHVFLTAQKRLNKSEEKSVFSNRKTNIANKHLELADLYAEDNQALKAVEQIIRYEEILQETTETVFKKVRLLKGVGKFGLASKILKDWVVYGQKNVDLLYEMAEIYYLDRKPLAALSACEKALALDSNHKQTLELYNKLKSTTFDLRL